MPWRKVLTKALAILALFVPLTSIYFGIRPGQLRWGATPAELVRSMPGDDVVTDPSLYATRAITIEGRPEDIWPWIVQIGYDRAGFYGYDLIENLGSKRGIHSAVTIVPELQHLAAGDRVYMSRIAYLVVYSIDPNRFLIWTADEKPAHSAFTFALFPLDENHTRLVVRARIRYHWTKPWILLDLFTEFGDHVAVPRMLLGIKGRAEGRPIQRLAVQGIEISVWIAALVEFLIALVWIARRRQWWPAWLAALTVALVLVFVLYARKPIWTGVALQAPAVAAMIWASKADRKVTCTPDS